jgi:hypothetical protein
MAYINVPHQVSSRINVADFVFHLYRACREPRVLETGADAARAVGNAARHVGKFVNAFRGAWVNS